MDRLLEKFKIQTKVVILVLPLLITIITVGGIGVYATRILEKRLNVSSDIVQLLSGYKAVYADITMFLRDPTAESYKKAVGTTEEQIADIDSRIRILPPGQDVSQLAAARDATGEIIGHVDSIWSHREERERLLGRITDRVNELNSLQTELGKYAFKIVAKATQERNQRQSRLSETMRFQELVNRSEILAANFAEDVDAAKMAAIQSKMSAYADEISANKRLLTSFGVRDYIAFLTAVKTFTDLPVEADFVTASAIYDGVRRHLSDFADEMRVRNSEALTRIAPDLANISSQSSEADNVNKKLRSIVANSSEVRISVTRIMSDPSEDSVKSVERALFVYQSEVNLLKDLATIDAYFADVPNKFSTVTTGLLADSVSLNLNVAASEEKYLAATTMINSIWEQMNAYAASQRQMASSERAVANSISLSSIALGFLIAVASGAALVLTLKRPIGSITNTMRLLAGGALDVPIEGSRRSDEIGEMARALAVFKDNAAQKLAIQAQTQELQQRADLERATNEHQRAVAAQNVEDAVRLLASGLKNLADRNLQHLIDEPFAGHLDKLRQDFNATVGGLNTTMLDVSTASMEIKVNGRLLADATEELSRRNEQQASSIERTAATISGITHSVAEASRRSASAADTVLRVKVEADASLSVVQNAVGAMSRIKEASDRISSIVSVIDGIAFQTNLLALNAGVEAARAGEAGKGFAVVAQEVRELAQRAAMAAKEIAALIHHSTIQVAAGVDFVEQTGGAISDIATKIGDISRDVEEIAQSNQSQAESLREVSTVVGTMERVTQLNAAMAEEAGAATRRLAEQVDDLVVLVGSFALREAASPTDDVDIISAA